MPASVWGGLALFRTFHRPQAIVLGLVLCGAAGLIGWATYRIGVRRGLFERAFELQAGFRQVHGIDCGTPVRYRGLDAGHVTAVEIPSADPRQRIVVRLKIKQRFQPLLPSDSRLHVVSDGMFGGKILNIEPGAQLSRLLADGDEITVVEPTALTDLIAETTRALNELRESQGTISKLLTTDEVHTELVRLVRQIQEMTEQARRSLEKTQDTLQEGKEAFAALKQDAEAIKRMPIVRSYVEDPVAILYRPDQDCDRRIFDANDLFEPGTSILTEAGRQHLRNLSSWLENGKSADTEIVVVSYLNQETKELPGSVAQVLTWKQSEAVSAYLRDHLRAHRVHWLSSRKIVVLGMGYAPPPIPEREPLPPHRTEILLFRPR